MLPTEGSKWTDHPAFLPKYHSAHVWTFLMWTWGGVANSRHLFVLETTASDGKPYRRAVDMDQFFVEFVPAKKGKAAK